MASMSDIAFLLIIFFITSMSFLYRQGLKLSLPKRDAAPVVMPASSILTLALDSKGALTKNGKPVSLSGIDLQKESAAIIRVDPACPYKYLVALIEALQQHDITKISVKPLVLSFNHAEDRYYAFRQEGKTT